MPGHIWIPKCNLFLFIILMLSSGPSWMFYAFDSKWHVGCFLTATILSVWPHPHFVWLPAPFLTAFERLVRKSAGRPCPNVTPSVFALSTPHYHTTRTTTTAKRTTTSRATWQPMFSHPGLSHLAHYPKQPPPPLLSHSCSHVTWDLRQLHFPFVNTPPSPSNVPTSIKLYSLFSYPLFFLAGSTPKN